MDRKQTQITLTETDHGFNVEVTGKSLKEMLSCCCLPVFAGGIKMSECCPDAKISECCPPAEDKK